MALKNRSVATIDSPEFINLQDNAICPGVSKCDIKVFYLGKNRNGSFIDKNVAIQMANSLPACPIVGAWREDTEDFGDHGEVIHIENGKVEFKCSTIPFGFVAPDADIWFQKFTDTDEFGNDIEREYMMTTGYLWTGQYPECAKAIEEGQPQSMEINDVDGHWANDSKSGMDFFIINDAVFSKLCILGDDVEPCFEGASVVGHEDKQFSNGESFTRTLFSMMNELKNALENKGGSCMPNEEIQASEETVFEATEEVEEAPVADVVEETTEVFEESAPEVAEEVAEEPAADEVDDTAEEFAKDDKKEEDEDASDDAEDSDDDSESDDEDEKKKPSEKNSLE
ncbi:MAG TPA: hypothetical protein DCW90_00515, partial [Lachnospiraceae bacterium]|nr:hypothetical protein [Lachnospiraceae bacterium]